MIEDIRKIITYEEIINVEGGKKAPNDLRLIGVAAVLKILGMVKTLLKI